MTTTLVIPTVGRPSLERLLAALAHGEGPRPQRVIVVDDTPDGTLAGPLHWPHLPPVTVLRSYGGGPARARNLGWRHAQTSWVSFLDDDVLPDADWLARLHADLHGATPDIVGIQGRLRVPLPADRRPTDTERETAALAHSRWITADMTYRRSALAAVGGFDERFTAAYREDADLALRLMDAGGRLAVGTRWVAHPPRAEDDWASVRRQAGNADDVLMRRLHGPGWRRHAGAPLGRRLRHLAITAAGIAAVGLAAAGRPRLAALAALGWAAGTAEFAYARIVPGPRSTEEVRRMLLTSAVIPAAAAWHTARGWLAHRDARPWQGLPDLVLFDRDGTLVHNVPYNRDPDLVEPVLGGRQALDRLRREHIRVGVVTNQSGVAAGRITRDQLNAVNARVEHLLGPFDVWRVCRHGPDDGCECRKPAPGMVQRACVQVGADPRRCVVVGDTAGDVAAAMAAGAVGVLVPNGATRRSEISDAAVVCRDLDAAVDRILRGEW